MTQLAPGDERRLRPPDWTDDDTDPRAYQGAIDVKVKRELLFLNPSEKGINAMTQAAAAAAEPVKVKVSAPYRIVHEGYVHTGGDVVEVPFALAAQWIKSKWAERIPAPRKASSVKGEK